jgi:hypothetical protein
MRRDILREIPVFIETNVQEVPEVINPSKVRRQVVTVVAYPECAKRRPGTVAARAAQASLLLDRFGGASKSVEYRRFHAGI